MKAEKNKNNIKKNQHWNDYLTLNSLFVSGSMPKHMINKVMHFDEVPWHSGRVKLMYPSSFCCGVILQALFVWYLSCLQPFPLQTRKDSALTS